MDQIEEIYTAPRWPKRILCLFAFLIGLAIVGMALVGGRESDQTPAAPATQYYPPERDNPMERKAMGDRSSLIDDWKERDRAAGLKWMERKKPIHPASHRSASKPSARAKKSVRYSPVMRARMNGAMVIVAARRSIN